MTTPQAVRDVDLRRAAEREGSPAHDRPCVWIVPRGSVPPACGPGEDWVWEDADERDVSARLQRLTAMAGATQASVSSAAWLTGSSVAYRRDAAVLDLLGSGRPVPVASIDAVVGEPERTVAARRKQLISRLREVAADQGYEISWTGSGYLLHAVHPDGERR